MTGFLAEGWYFDGTPLDAIGHVIESRVGWDDAPAVRGGDSALIGRSGNRFRAKEWDAGRKDLVVGVHGLNDDGTVPVEGTEQRAVYEDRLDELLRLINVRHRLIDVHRVYADGSHRRAGCQVLNAITPELLGTNNTYGRVSFELDVPGSFWEDVDPLAYDLKYRVGAASPQELENVALIGQTAPCDDAVVTVTGPCDRVAVRDGQRGAGWSYPDSLGSGDVLVVDAGGFTATKNGASVVWGVVRDESRMLRISPAPSKDRGPSLIVDTSGASTGFSVVVTGRRRWLR